MPRYPRSTEELDEAERAWWSTNSDLEEQFCWVQHPRQQRLVRQGYIDAMLKEVPVGGRVLEVGCGTGWLVLLLARQGRSGIVGSDWSRPQIERARAAAKAEGLEDRVSFVIPGTGGDAEGLFDVVIMHAFLHHLSTEEISGALAAAADRLAPGGRLLVLEPVHFAGGAARGPNVLRALRRIESLPRRLASRGLRRQGEAEIAARRRLAEGAAGALPFGPAPKEIPFEPDELEALLAADFTIEDRRPVLSMAHVIARELLLAALSQPRLWRFAERPLLGAAAALDRRFVNRPELPSTVWVFVLYVCSKRAP